MGYRCGGGGVPVQDGDVMGWRCDCEVLIGWWELGGFASVLLYGVWSMREGSGEVLSITRPDFAE